MLLKRAAKRAARLGVLVTIAIGLSVGLSSQASATQYCYEPGPWCLGHQPGVNYPDDYSSHNLQNGDFGPYGWPQAYGQWPYGN